MEHKTSLGRSQLQVPRMGVGAMTWGDAKGWPVCIPPRSLTAGLTDSMKRSAH